jgi:hypothetical protein
MNSQLINDHAEHCDFYIGNEHYDKSYEEQQRLWAEKFAEYIVQECITMIQLSTTRDPQDTVQYKQSVGHIHKIRDHFGINT